MIAINYSKQLKKIEASIHQWKRRALTPIGKITLIKSLLLPKLVHLFQTLPNPSESFIKNIDTIFYNFIWNGPVDRIKREILIKQYCEGGLKMLNVQIFANAIKLTWLRRFTSNKKWMNVFFFQN